MPVSVAIELRSGGRAQDRVASLGSGGHRVLALADGAGGTGSGAQAAERVIEAARQLYAGHHGSPVAALQAADADIADLGGLSTGIIVELRDGLLHGASCGDSVAWLLGHDECLELTAQQQRKPLLGDGAWPVAFGPLPCRGRLLLASDGLVHHAPYAAILAAARMPDLYQAARMLADLPRLPNETFPDDVAVLLAQVAG